MDNKDQIIMASKNSQKYMSLSKEKLSGAEKQP